MRCSGVCSSRCSRVRQRSWWWNSWQPCASSVTPHRHPSPRASRRSQRHEGDKELLEIFLEEGFDIAESAGAALLRWQADPRNGVEVENLLRDLHTLKGGARMVEIAPIGDLAHELEFLYEHLAAGQLQPSPALFSLLQNCHDRLAHMLDAVRLHQPLHAATALIDYIRNFSSAALSDTAAATPGAEVAPVEVAAPSLERAPADMVKVTAELLDDLGNLAGENSIIRGRIEQQVNDAQVALGEMETTLERMRDQLRRLDTETQGASSAASRAKARRWAMTTSTRWKWTVIHSCSSCRGPCSSRPPICWT
ncbi:Hpt domain-containing protein [Pseudomonas qingdaonensis]|nr:Hpt domain-containing protein [Pseudomonas qingdaonensis]